MVPVVVVREVFDDFLDGGVNVIEGREFIFGGVVGGFVVDLVGLLLGGRGGLLDGEGLFGHDTRGQFLNRFLSLLFGQPHHRVLRTVRCLLLSRLVNVLF